MVFWKFENHVWKLSRAEESENGLLRDSLKKAVFVSFYPVVVCVTIQELLKLRVV